MDADFNADDDDDDDDDPLSSVLAVTTIDGNGCAGNRNDCDVSDGGGGGSIHGNSAIEVGHMDSSNNQWKPITFIIIVVVVVLIIVVLQRNPFRGLECGL